MEDNMKQNTEEVINTDGGVFSARLESLISSALQDGVLTDQEKAILKKRAEAEGEDWDEVEMIINARLAEMQNKSKPEQISDSNVIANSDDLCNQRIVTLYDCGFDTSSVTNAIVETLELLLGSKVFLIRFGSKEILKRCDAVVEGKPSTFELDSKEAAKHLMEEIEKAGGKAHLGNPTPEDMIAKKDKSFIEIPEGVIEIQSYACSHFNMEEVKLPSTLKKIGTQAFYDCTGLENVTIPENVEYIDNFAFGESGLRDVTILSKHLKKIGKFAFFKCKMRTISFPNGMEQIRIDDDAIPRSAKVFLPASMKKVRGLNEIENIYCFSPQIEELEELCGRFSSSLYVLPDYLESYISQAKAEGIDSKITILPMPDEYLYFYDN